MTQTIIITAGGIGKRMGASIPKQFIELNGLPVLMHTIQRFYNANPSFEIIVVLPDAHIQFWKELIDKHLFRVKHQIVEGGKERFFSIKNGLKHATGELIGVHDGVRPFVSLEVIEKTYQAAKTNGAAIPVVNLKESVRQIDQNNSLAVDRTKFKIVQTPQCFRADIIQKSYLQPYSSQFTDDASVVELSGHQISLVDGNDENIKITTPMDLKLAEVLCNK